MERVRELMSDPQRGLLKLAWPAIVSMLFSTLLHFVDFFFVGGLGPDALAGVQLSFPIFFLIVAIGSGVSIGGTSLIARRLGEGNKKWAEETALHALLLGIILSVAFMALLPFMGGISQGLGGSPEVAQLASEYLTVIFSGVIVFFTVFSMTAILQGEGDTKTPMKLAILFTVANIIMDPIFIYVLGMGIAGAALATVLAEVISLSVYFWYVVLAKRSMLQVRPREFIYTPPIIKNILRVGIPAAMSQIALSIAVLGVNLILSGFGDLPISAYGIGFRIDSLAILPMLGLAAGVIPLIGYFKGAKDYAGARKVNRLALKLVLGFSVLVGAAIFLLAGTLPSVFTSDPAVIEMASNYLRIIAFSYPFIGTVIIVSASFQGLGRGVPSFILTMTRAIGLVLPISYYLAYHTGLRTAGVWLGIAVAAVITATFGFGWVEHHFRKLCGKCGL